MGRKKGERDRESEKERERERETPNTYALVQTTLKITIDCLCRVPSRRFQDTCTAAATSQNRERNDNNRNREREEELRQRKEREKKSRERAGEDERRCERGKVMEIMFPFFFCEFLSKCFFGPSKTNFSRLIKRHPIVQAHITVAEFTTALLMTAATLPCQKLRQKLLPVIHHFIATVSLERTSMSRLSNRHCGGHVALDFSEFVLCCFDMTLASCVVSL